MTATRIAVVGAGMAGLSCARALVAAGARVTLFDKGRQPGGRIATRRRAQAVFNHGAQYATACDPGFKQLMSGLEQAGAAAAWPQAGGGHVRWSGVPDMSAMGRVLADELRSAGAAVRTGRTVCLLRARPEGWQVRHAPAADVPPGWIGEQGNADGPFDGVALAIPSPQAHALLAAIGHGFAAQVADVSVAPCWTLMLHSSANAPDTLKPEGGPLGWIAREASRPGAPPGAAGCWTAQAVPGWSTANLERDPDDVARDLAVEFARLVGPARDATAHRWRYAMTEQPLGTACLWDPQARLGVCGDWCLGARVELAYVSGAALGEAIGL